MSPSSELPATDPILDDLRSREPIFHTPAFGATLADFDRTMSSTYWEVGASGRIYTRAFILQYLAENPPINAAAAGWQTSGHAILRIAPDTYLLTYTLLQGTRRTRRSTLWQHTSTGWLILYHQGTLVSEDIPSSQPS